MFKKTSKTMFVLVMALALIFTSISTVAAADYEPPTKPVIKSFIASKTNIVMGDTVVLKWEVEGAKSIEILGLEAKGPEEKLPLKGELEMWPMASTSYVLNAYGDNGSMATKTVDVNVDVKGAVKVLSFTASKSQINSGETVLLKWKVQNAKSVEIIGLAKLPEKQLPALEGELEVWPLETTTFILQAVGYKGEIVSANVTVTCVDDPVSIKSLKVDPKEIDLGESATISWEALNATKVKISGIEGDLPAKGSVKVTPKKAATITYNMTAYGKNGDKAKASVDLVVNDKKPVIKSFKSTSYEVSRGARVTISWETENVDKCMILTSDGIKLRNRPANGKITITPNKTRSYTLVAYDDKENKAEKTITIKVK